MTSDVQAFLAAVRRDDPSATVQVLLPEPEVAHALAASSVHAACCLGDDVALRRWLDGDPALATQPDDAGCPPLVYACRARFHTIDEPHATGSLRCVELLLDRGADPDGASPGGGPPLSALYFACMTDHVSAVRLLLQRGANPNDSESVYHSAQLDRRACLELLAAHGAELSARDPFWNNTPLYFLAGHTERDRLAPAATNGMRWLLEHGADPNVRSLPSGETPLHRVAFQRGRPVAEMLLDHGADAGVPREDGRTPYALAVRAGNVPVMELFEERGAAGAVSAMDTLVGACMRGDGAAVRRILAERPRLVHEFTDKDRDMLSIAASHREGQESVRLMVELGFDVAWMPPQGATPLHHAAWRGNAAIVSLLLSLGAPVDVRDGTYGSSPLAWAAHGSHFHHGQDDDYCATVEALLAAGSSSEAAFNRWGDSPATLASPAVAELLRASAGGPVDRLRPPERR